MALSKFANKSTAPQATAAADATVAQPEAIEQDNTFAVSMLGNTGGAVTIADAINAAVTAGGNSDASERFPLINVTGGPSGGMFEPLATMPQELQDALPSGKKPIQGVLMGFRYHATAWPAGYADTDAQAAAQPSGEKTKSKPVYAVAIGNTDVDGVKLLMAAAKNYQYTKTADKAKFDYAASKAGHLKPALELLVWLPEVEAPVVVSSAYGHGCVVESLTSLQTLVDPKTGSLGQFPAQVRSVSQEKTSKSGYKFKVHALEVSNTMNTGGSVELYKAYTGWIQEAAKDPGTVQKVRDWLSGADRPLNSEIAAALKACAAL